MPDITLLPLIAEFFCVSIDALLDYDAVDSETALLRAANNPYIMNGDFQAGIPLCLEAVRKYGNDYRLNYYLATLYQSRTFSQKGHPDRENAMQAIRYFDRAITLNRGEDPGVECLKKDQAFIFRGLGEYEKALALLDERHVVERTDCLIHLGRYAEAKNILQAQLFNQAFNFAYLTDLLGKCMKHEEKPDESARKAFLLTELCAHFREGFTSSDSPCYFDNLVSSDYLDVACFAMECGNIEEMWAALRVAADHAIRFDWNPSFRIQDIPFMEGLEGFCTASSSALACRRVLNALSSEFAGFAEDERYQSVKSDCEAAQRTKREAGIWQ